MMSNKTLPNFGEFSKQKKELIASKKSEMDLLGENQVSTKNRYVPTYEDIKDMYVLKNRMSLNGRFFRMFFATYTLYIQ